MSDKRFINIVPIVDNAAICRIIVPFYHSRREEQSSEIRFGLHWKLFFNNIF